MYINEHCSKCTHDESTEINESLICIVRNLILVGMMPHGFPHKVAPTDNAYKNCDPRGAYEELDGTLVYIKSDSEKTFKCFQHTSNRKKNRRNDK